MSLRAASLIIDEASVEVLVPAAATLALNTTRYLLIPAPGPGRVILPEVILFEKAAGTAGTGGGNIILVHGPSGTNALISGISRANLFPAGASRYQAAARNESVSVNQPLMLYMQTANLGANNRHLNVYVKYSVWEIG